MSASRVVRPEAAKAWASCRAPWTGIRPTAARRPPTVAAIWIFIPGYPALAEYRSGIPANPGGTGHTVDQHGSRSHHPDRVGHELSENLPDQRAQHIPAPTHGGLADTEDRTGEGLGNVGTHHTHHQRH